MLTTSPCDRENRLSGKQAFSSPYFSRRDFSLAVSAIYLGPNMSLPKTHARPDTRTHGRAEERLSVRFRELLTSSLRGPQ